MSILAPPTEAIISKSPTKRPALELPIIRTNADAGPSTPSTPDGMPVPVTEPSTYDTPLLLVPLTAYRLLFMGSFLGLGTTKAVIAYFHGQTAVLNTLDLMIGVVLTVS